MIKKIEPQKDNFRDVFNKIDQNFEYLERLIRDSAVRLNYERFKASDGSIITLSRPYQMNNNSIELYIDGVRQHPDTFLELNPRTIQILNIRDLDQIIDIYYRESFIIDSSRRDSDLAPIYTLTNTYKVEHTAGRMQIDNVSNPIIVPSSGILWRILITPKHIPSVGSFTIEFFNKTTKDTDVYTKYLFDSDDNIDEYYSIIKNSNVIVIDTHRNKDWKLEYFVGDEININFKTKDATIPASNEFMISYVIKQSTSEVNL